MIRDFEEAIKIAAGILQQELETHQFQQKFEGTWQILDNHVDGGSIILVGSIPHVPFDPGYSNDEVRFLLGTDDIGDFLPSNMVVIHLERVGWCVRPSFT